jgi:ActR/RegA family two-component response regulator
MPSDSSEPAASPEAPLDRVALIGRLAGELARLRRSGGFLSLAIVGEKGPRGTGKPDAAELAETLRTRVRLHDVVARLDGAVAIVMPHATAREARAAGRRLLDLCAAERAPLAGRLAVGTATVFRDVEGGALALLGAALEALEKAPAGHVSASLHLEGRPRILVVDDDPGFARALSDSITERGWEAHPCTNVEDALERVASPTYSGLFVDLVLPRGNGVAVLRKAIAFHPKRPAVLMSGFDAEQAGVMEALELGPVTFVRKPLSGADLDGALEMFRSLLPGAPGGARTPRG